MKAGNSAESCKYLCIGDKPDDLFSCTTLGEAYYEVLVAQDSNVSVKSISGVQVNCPSTSGDQSLADFLSYESTLANTSEEDNAFAGNALLERGETRRDPMPNMGGKKKKMSLASGKPNPPCKILPRARNQDVRRSN